MLTVKTNNNLAQVGKQQPLSSSPMTAPVTQQGNNLVADDEKSSSKTRMTDIEALEQRLHEAIHLRDTMRVRYLLPVVVYCVK